MVKWEQNRALNPPPRHSITKSFVSIYFSELIFILNNVPGSFRRPRFTFAPSSLQRTGAVSHTFADINRWEEINREPRKALGVYFILNPGCLNEFRFPSAFCHVGNFNNSNSACSVIVETITAFLCFHLRFHIIGIPATCPVLHRT